VFTDGPEPAFSGNVDALLSTTERARRNAWIAHVESFLGDRVVRCRRLPKFHIVLIRHFYSPAFYCVPANYVGVMHPTLSSFYKIPQVAHQHPYWCHHCTTLCLGSSQHNGDAQRNMSRTLCPVFFTCSRLANTFGCSPSFVSYVAPLSPSQQRATLAKRDREHEKARARWGEKAALIREIRKKRKEFW
jgi:hypothetical protein